MSKYRSLFLVVTFIYMFSAVGCQMTSSTSTTSGVTSSSTGTTSSTNTTATTPSSSTSTSGTTDNGSMSDLEGNSVVSNPTDAGVSSAAQNALNLLSKGVIRRGSKAFDGRLNFTQYGGPTDGTPDKYTKEGLGNRNNKLNQSSLALSPDLIKKYGLRGGERISIKTGKGTFYLGKYDDTTGNKREPNVIDVYDPTDSLGKDNFMANIPPGQWELVIG